MCAIFGLIGGSKMATKIDEKLQNKFLLEGIRSTYRGLAEILEPYP